MRIPFITLFALIAGASASAQTTFTVTTTAEAGTGSLRQAILDANVRPGADAIAFAIAGAGPHTIQVQSALPSVTDAVTIDGLTQPGARCDTWPATLLVVINGSQAPDDTDGLTLAADAAVLRGLVIGEFQASSPTNPVGGNGVVITGDDAVLTCNFIGAVSTGVGFLSNEGAGIRVVHADGARIGGAAQSDRNLVTGNRYGIRLDGATGTRIQGNYIGPWASGLFGGNYRAGVLLENGASGNTVGGRGPGEGNLINANRGNGVRIEGGATTGNTVAGNLIGLDPTGSFPVPNSAEGVAINGATGNTVGGLEPGSRNVISGNDGSGVLLSNGATGNVVQGNAIGIGPAGLVARPNLGDGVFILKASGNTIGGTEAGARNVISGNETIGVEIDGTGGAASGNVVAGNYIGVDGTGTAALPNLDDGVLIENAAGNTIGGDTEAARNVISANRDDGVDVFGSTTRANVVRHNRIGTNAEGTALLGNSEDGIDINGGATETLVSDNVIAGNTEIGVRIADSGTRGNAVRRNQVYGNTGLGIDIESVGRDDNDPGDADEDANRQQNYPVLASVTGNGVATLTITYAVDTAPASATYPLTVDFYRADAAGQGHTWVGQHVYATPQASAVAAFTPAAVVADGDRFVATATDAAGNTSEFSDPKMGVGAVAADDAPGDDAFALTLAPNPVRTSATLRLTVGRAGPATVTVVDALGRRVALLHDGPLAAGTHALPLDTSALSPGVYVVRAVMAGGVVSRRLTVVR